MKTKRLASLYLIIAVYAVFFFCTLPPAFAQSGSSV
jgi:hypothetical protein